MVGRCNDFWVVYSIHIRRRSPQKPCLLSCCMSVCHILLCTCCSGFRTSTHSCRWRVNIRISPLSFRVSFLCSYLFAFALHGYCVPVCSLAFCGGLTLTLMVIGCIANGHSFHPVLVVCVVTLLRALCVYARDLFFCENSLLKSCRSSFDRSRGTRKRRRLFLR